MNQIQIFSNPEFGNIRTLTIDGELWFVARDLAEALGYQQTNNMKRVIADDDKRLIDPQSAEFSGFRQNGVSIEPNVNVHTLLIINESGLYSAIFGSTLPNAKEFKRWVTSEILPSIRKTGSYQSGQSIPHTYREQLLLVMAANEEVNARVDNVETEISTIKNDFSAFRDDLPLFPKELEAINKAVKAKGMDIVHGKDSPAYRSCYKKVVRDIYSMLWREFDCSSYKDIPRCYLGMVPGMIEKYEAPFVLLNAIRESNEEVR